MTSCRRRTYRLQSFLQSASGVINVSPLPLTLQLPIGRARSCGSLDVVGVPSLRPALVLHMIPRTISSMYEHLPMSKGQRCAIDMVCAAGVEEQACLDAQWGEGLHCAGRSKT